MNKSVVKAHSLTCENVLSDTVHLESLVRGKWNSRCSGEMRRYLGEYQWRRQLAVQGTDAEERKRRVSNGIRYPGSPTL